MTTNMITEDYPRRQGTAVTEDYVSFEIAKLLKENGFDINVCQYYQKIDDDITYHIEDFRNWNVYDMWYSMPTLQMAMKWLREVHNLFIMIDCGDGAYVWSIADMSNGNVILKVDAVVGYYEEACEAAIKYCLKNLI